MSAVTGSFFTVTDIEAMKADREFAQKFSITQPEAIHAPSIQFNSWREWVLEHRYKIVGFTWLTVAAGTLLYQWKRKDISSSQKIINARLSSQALALIGFGAIAGVSAGVVVEPKPDPHFESVISGATQSK